PSQHLESQNRPAGNPLRFCQAMKRSSSGDKEYISFFAKRYRTCSRCQLPGGNQEETARDTLCVTPMAIAEIGL
ncbi:hypothetical protein, partial [Rhizobium sp. IMFF44]|uniref:hypothetical protein n=1 Tax=Rhizobium sp. IMFF44 TaxID=3342350 RepID=UPI0035B6EB52